MPTSVHHDPDVEDRSQHFLLVHAGWLAKVDMNGSETARSALNWFADTPDVPSICEQCPSLGRCRRGRPPGSKLSRKMVRRRLDDGGTGGQEGPEQIERDNA